MADMAKTLEEALKKARELPDEQQDEAAEMPRSVVAKHGNPHCLMNGRAPRSGRGATKRAVASSRATRPWLPFSSGMA